MKRLDVDVKQRPRNLQQPGLRVIGYYIYAKPSLIAATSLGVCTVEDGLVETSSIMGCLTRWSTET